MKKLLIALLVVLLVWNSYLTIELMSVKKGDGTGPVVNQTVNSNTINGYTTDVTNVVSKTESKVVGITNITQNEEISSGSGVIYSKDDTGVYIVTNQHVIAEANEIKVLFDNGEELSAELIGSDHFSDLALLRVTPEFEVIPFNLGDSSILKKGEYVLAIGSPLGEAFYGTTTFGIISGKDRVIGVDLDGNGTEDWDMIVLQTDAAINPGNSGGPLINLSGDLIGITSMKIDQVDVEGMGFAIPINEVIPIVEQLKVNGTVIRPMLGISGKDISDLTVYQKSFLGINLDRTKGLLITDVSSGSPASLGGIQAGDILIKFGDFDINSFKSFRKSLYSMNIGDEVNMIILRGNDEITLPVILK